MVKKVIVDFQKSTAFGRVSAPPSKSIAHRYLICSALSKGQSIIRGIKLSDDIKATIDCLRSLGAKIQINGNTVNILGIQNFSEICSQNLNCNESGSTLRFLIPVCLLYNREIKLNGSERLMQRSLSVYKDICDNQGIQFVQNNTFVEVKGKLESGKYSVRGDISSQFLSGLMFALPLLSNDSIIDITSTFESASYLNMTIKCLADFGISVKRLDERTFYIRGNQAFKPRELKVEGDYSNAAFLDAFNVIGGNVAVTGLNKKTAQGDSVYKELFKELISGTPQIDVSDCPDLAPVLMAIAAAKNGAILTGTKRLKIKESDRGAAMAEELVKFGVDVENNYDTVVVHKGSIKKPDLPLDGHNDHRVVMSLALLCSLTGGTIYGAEAISKSFPDFFTKINKLGVMFKVDSI